MRGRTPGYPLVALKSQRQQPPPSGRVRQHTYRLQRCHVATLPEPPTAVLLLCTTGCCVCFSSQQRPQQHSSGRNVLFVLYYTFARSYTGSLCVCVSTGVFGMCLVALSTEKQHRGEDLFLTRHRASSPTQTQLISGMEDRCEHDHAHFLHKKKAPGRERCVRACCVTPPTCPLLSVVSIRTRRKTTTLEASSF